MRNIISVQLERPSYSESLMVYSKCLMNIKMWTPARNTDLSESRWSLAPATKNTKQDRGYSRNNKIPAEKMTPVMHYATVMAIMLKKV